MKLLVIRIVDPRAKLLLEHRDRAAGSDRKLGAAVR
jgi:hypothetical protein